MKMSRMNMLMVAACFALPAMLLPERALGGEAPTHADVAYGDHERNKLDFWQAKSATPTPLLLYVHGGGFTQGDKAAVHRFVPVRRYVEQGISVASINYPFLQHTGNDYQAIMRHCEKALDFILSKRKEWNIDPRRVAVSGASAGALVSEWLGYSTGKIRVLGVYLQPMGTDRMILGRLRKGFPPMIIYQGSPPSDSVHHPRYAQMLKKACDSKGLTCVLWGTGKNGIEKHPKGKEPKEFMLEFFLKHFGGAGAEKSKILGDVKIKHCKYQAKSLAGTGSILMPLKSLDRYAQKDNEKGKEAKALAETVRAWVSGETRRLVKQAKTLPGKTYLEVSRLVKRASGLPEYAQLKELQQQLSTDRHVKALSRLLADLEKTNQWIAEKGASSSASRKLESIRRKLEALAARKDASDVVAAEARGAVE